ncbi:hypothetical protein PORY_000329 [Pneumocystis oryctolagi]|uniref:Uncharacterized protein n=1 Tax=Pneumocystis oryctolagi TaxID=42067 RepID=A0ACB7CFH6_9ASCO|nr:hypothetical protein PORY_000329 [Pneumocystis oryctolagi]
MRSAATKINWTKLRSCYGLNTSTVSSLLEFQKRNSDAWTKVGALQEQVQDINFDHYRSILRNHSVLNEIEKDVKAFRPLKYNTVSQIKTIDQFETKALENAKKTAENVTAELVLLEKTLLNIQKARPIEDLTVNDVLTACPEIEKKVEKMIEKEQWSVPGYKEKFGNLTIMLAATLGSKSSLKKLQKREILSVNVPKACKYLSEPPEPLALRLSSNLMMGVTRIFDQKREILSVNVPKACKYLSEPPEPLALRLSSNLMMGVTRIFDQQYGFLYTDVQLAHAKIRKELITMTVEKANIDLPPAKTRSDLFTLSDDPTFIPDLNDYGWSGSLPLLETSFDIEMGLQEDSSSSINLSETPVSFSQHILPRSSFSGSNTTSKLEFAGSISRSAINMSSLIEKDNDILGSAGDDVLFDFEFNEDGEIRKIDNEQKHPENFIQKHDNISFRLDSDEGEENVRREHAEARKRKKLNHTFGETLIAYEEVDENALNEYTEAEILETKDPSFIPQNRAEEISSDIHENDNQQRKKRKLTKPKTDISTELLSEDLISWRDNYVKNMEKQSILRTRKLQEKAAINNVSFFMSNCLNEIMHPALKTLFLVNPKQENLNQKKRTRENELNHEPFNSKTNDSYMKVRRSTVEMQSNFEEDIEVGRHVDEELTRRTSSLMPWNQSRISSRAGSIGPGMASISFDTPKMGGVGQISSTGRKSRLTASPLDDRLDNIDMNIEEDRIEDFDIFGTTNLDAHTISHDDYQSTIMEKELYNFLEYTQARIYQKEKDRAITFEELVPVSNSSRSVASQALCHVLCKIVLASRNILTVHQAEPYEDIWIKLN